MRPEEHIQKAEEIVRNMRSASTIIGTGPRAKQIRGVDPNELKKILVFLIRYRDMSLARRLVDSLPGSTFAKRSQSTPGYYKNIQSVLNRGFYTLPVEDAVQILGWVCRLL